MNEIQTETKFNRGAWQAIGISATILLLCLLQIGYRMSLPSEGWIFPLDLNTGEQRYLFSQHFENQPTPFQTGDILVSIEGQSTADLTGNAITLAPQRPANWQVGQTVQYTVLRDNQELTLDVQLQSRSLWAYLKGLPTSSAWSPGTLLTIIIGLFIFSLRPGSRATQFFLVWCIVNLANILSMLVSGQAGSPADMFYVGAYWPAYIFDFLIFPFCIVPMLAHFFLFFPVVKTPLQRQPKLTPVAIYGFSILVVVPTLFSKLDQPLLFWAALLNVAFPILVPTNLLIKIGSLAHTALAASQLVVRTQARWLLIGYILGDVIGSGILFFLPKTGIIEKSLPLTVITALFVTVFPVSLAITIFRYRLFDIDIIIRRTLIYGSLTALGFGVYFLLVGGASTLLQTQNNLLPAIVAMGLVVVLFRPLLRRLQNTADRFMPLPERPVEETPVEPPPSHPIEQSSSPDSSQANRTLDEPDTTLHNPWLTIARVFWVVIVVMSIGLWVIGGIELVSQPPPFCDQVGCDPFDLSAQDVNVLQELQLPVGFFRGISAAILGIMALSFFVIAGLIFWRKSDDWMGLLVSFVLIFMGAVFFTSNDDAVWRAYVQLRLPLAIVLILGYAALMLLFFYFPDGRLVPSWRLFHIPFPLFLIFVSSSVAATAGRAINLQTIVGSGVIFLGFVAQIYRYRRVSGQQQRQQTKWVVFGLIASILVMLIWMFTWFNFPPNQPSIERLYFLLLLSGIVPILIMALPISIAFSILHYQLWDIDLIIRRTLIYGVLTALGFGAYFLLVGGTSALLQTQSNLLPLLVAVGVVVVLFVPLRKRLQGVMDQVMPLPERPLEENAVDESTAVEPSAPPLASASDEPLNETKFNRGSWQAIGISAIILLLCLLQIGYRMSLPSEGWIFPFEISTGEVRYVFTRYFEKRPTPFQTGDALVAVEGQPIKEMVENAIKLNPKRPANWQPGQSVQYTVLRDDQQLELTVQLQPRSFLAYLAELPASTAWAPGLLLTVLIGLFIFAMRPGSRAAQLFLIWNIIILTNMITSPVSGQNGSPAELFHGGAYWPASFFNILIYPLFIHPVLMVFFLVFPVVKYPIRRWLVLTLVLIFGWPLLVVVLSMFSRLDQPLQVWAVMIQAFYPLIFPAVILVPILSLGHTARTAPDLVQRTQARWLLTGFIIGWALGNGVLFLLPELDIIEKSLPLTVIIALCVLALPFSLAVAIFRYRLFDIDLIIRRTLIYGSLVGGLALAYFGSVALIQFMSQTFTGPQSNLVVVIITLAIAALFNPARTRFQVWIDRRFYREKVDFRQAFTTFAREVRTIIDLSELLRVLVTRTTDLLHITHGAVFLHSEDDTFQLVEARNLPDGTEASLPLNTDNLPHLQDGHPISQPKDKTFPLLVPLIAPVTSQSKIQNLKSEILIGVLALGPRLSEQHYSREDQTLLGGLADQAGTAIYVAQLIEEKQAEATRREETERQLQAYHNSPAGRAEALAQTLATQPTTALHKLHTLTQQAGSDPEAAALLEPLSGALATAKLPLLAGIADGYRYIFASQTAPELLSVGLRELTTQLASPAVEAIPNASTALGLYQLCQQALEANSIPRIVELLPTLPQQDNKTSKQQEDDSPLLDLLRTLTEFIPTAEALHAYERVDTPQDKLAYLASAVERLGHVGRLSQAELGSADRPIIQRIVETWRAVVTGAMSELQTQARIVCRLLTRHTWTGEVISLALSLRNEGRGPALNIKVNLVPASEYTLFDKMTHIERLSAGEEQQVELQVRPRLAQGLSRFRARFIILYDDPRGPDQVENFADVVHLLDDEGEFQFIPNPYIVGTPLQSDSSLFFGREDIIAFIQDNLAAAHQNNLVLIGQRRTGKTSLLKQLSARLGDQYLPVYLDGQSLALDPGLPNFFFSLATEITFALEDRDFILEPPDLSDFIDNPSTTFERDFMVKVRDAIGTRHLLLLLDEFEELESAVQRGNIDEYIFGFLRHLIQHTANLSVIFCGTHRMEELAADYWSVLFNISLYRHVAYLSQDEALRLIQEPVEAFGMRYDDLALEKMWRVTAGHPYFLQLLCHSLVNQHNKNQRNYVTVADVNEALDEILASGEAHFIFMWTESSHEERLVVTALSRMMPLTGRATPVQVTDYLTERGITLDRRAVGDALHHLALRDTLRINAKNGDEGQIDVTLGNTDTYSWQLGLLGLWAEKYKSLSRVVDEVR